MGGKKKGKRNAGREEKREKEARRIEARSRSLKSLSKHSVSSSQEWRGKLDREREGRLRHCLTTAWRRPQEEKGKETQKKGRENRPLRDAAHRLPHLPASAPAASKKRGKEGRTGKKKKGGGRFRGDMVSHHQICPNCHGLKEGEGKKRRGRQSEKRGKRRVKGKEAANVLASPVTSSLREN